MFNILPIRKSSLEIIISVIGGFRRMDSASRHILTVMRRVLKIELTGATDRIFSFINRIAPAGRVPEISVRLNVSNASSGGGAGSSGSSMPDVLSWK